MKTKAIIFDIDGTAIDSPKQKSPSKRLINAVNKLINEYFLTAATGRVWSFAKPVLQKMKLVDPCIISAGTQICNPVTGQILWQKNLNNNSLREVVKLFKQYPDYKLLFNDGTEDEYFNGGVYPADFKTKEPVYFLEQVFVPDKLAIKIYKELKGVSNITCVMVISQKPGRRDLHIVNSLATKEQAIAELLKCIGIERKNTIGIGDGHNDIHLFNAVNYKIAMGNAAQELKKIADKVIGTAANDGMAKYLETLI